MSVYKGRVFSLRTAFSAVGVGVFVGGRVGGRVEVGVGGIFVETNGEKGVEDGVAFETSVTKMKSRAASGADEERTHPAKSNPPQRAPRTRRYLKFFLCGLRVLGGKEFFTAPS